MNEYEDSLTSSEWSRIKYFIDELPPNDDELFSEYITRFREHTSIDGPVYKRKTISTEDAIETMLTQMGYNVSHDGVNTSITESIGLRRRKKLKRERTEEQLKNHYATKAQPES